MGSLQALFLVLASVFEDENTVRLKQHRRRNMKPKLLWQIVSLFAVAVNADEGFKPECVIAVYV